MSNETFMDMGVPRPSDSLSLSVWKYLNLETPSIQKTRIENSLYKEIKSIVADYVYSQDIVQLHQSLVIDTIVERVFFNFSEFRFQSSIQTWIFAIAKNSCSDFFKTKSFKENSLVDPITFGEDEFPLSTKHVNLAISTSEILRSNTSPERVILSKESNDLINSSIKKLHKEDQNIIKLLYFHGLTSKDIGEELSIKKSTFSYRKKRILKQLKSDLKK